MGWNLLHPSTWFDDESKPPAKLPAKPPAKPAPGEVSAQTYALSTGKAPPRNTPPILESRAKDAWRTQLLRDAAANPPATQEWKQKNLWKPGAGPAQPAPEGLNRTNQTLLSALGWTVPGAAPAATGATFDEMLDASKGQDLKSYSYKVSKPELELLQNAVKGKLGVTEGKNLAEQDRTVKTGTVRAVPLTMEAYKALTPDQKKAVDFNTAFLQAREKDLSLTDETGKTGDYDKSVENLFGKGGEGDKYAPNTVKLLEDIGYKAKGQDLDEYLSLDRVVSMDELASFKAPEGEFKQAALKPRSVVGVTDFLDTRSTANQLLADAALVQQAGAFIDEALKNPAAWDLRSATALKTFGELPKGMDAPFGYAPFDSEGISTYRQNAEGGYDTEGDMYKDAFFKNSYDQLSNPEQDISGLWTGVKEHGLEENDIQDMFNYFDIRSKRDLEVGVVDPALRSPDAMRSLLGLGS